MNNKKWKFSEAENTMVFSTKQVASGKMPIIYVSHDGEDGSWEFHGIKVEMKDAIMVSLKEIVDLDKSLNDLYDLPCGFVATRRSRNEPWKREQNED